MLTVEKIFLSCFQKDTDTLKNIANYCLSNRSAYFLFMMQEYIKAQIDANIEVHKFQRTI